MDLDGRRDFRKSVEEMIDSWLWEMNNQLLNRIPDPVDYIEMRRRTFGSDLTMNLCRIGLGDAVPPEIYRTGPMQSLQNAAQDYAMLLNDVFSYQKEIEFEGEIHNGILVVQNFFDCDYATGLRIIDDLMNSRMRQFQHVVAHELPTLYDDFDLDDTARDALDGYVKELENWLSGILVWHRECFRYKEADLIEDRAGLTRRLPHPLGPRHLGDPHQVPPPRTGSRRGELTGPLRFHSFAP